MKASKYDSQTNAKKSIEAGYNIVYVAPKKQATTLN